MPQVLPCCSPAAENDGLCVREDSGDAVASRALDVHKERLRVGNEAFQLVLLCLFHGVRVQQVDLHFPG